VGSVASITRKAEFVAAFAALIALCDDPVDRNEFIGKLREANIIPADVADLLLEELCGGAHA
jgi:hypothetical protein